MSGFLPAELEDNSILPKNKASAYPGSPYPQRPTFVKADSRGGQTGQVRGRVQEETTQLRILARKKGKCCQDLGLAGS